MKTMLEKLACYPLYGESAPQTLCVSFHDTHEALRNPRRAVWGRGTLILGALGPE